MESRELAVDLPDGPMPAHLWVPEGGAGPGVLLVQEIFGVSAYIRRRAADLAAEGYVVLAPELYWRLPRQTVDESAPDALQQAMGLAAQVSLDQAVADSAAALAALAERPEVRGRPGLLGFCFGGGVAYAVAARTEPAALVAYYGSALGDLLHLAPQVTCPSLHHFGTADDFVPPETVARIADTVTAEGRPARFERYEGANHAFDNADFPMFHDEASRRAWAVTLEFLHAHLGAAH